MSYSEKVLDHYENPRKDVILITMKREYVDHFALLCVSICDDVTDTIIVGDDILHQRPPSDIPIPNYGTMNVPGKN